MKIKGSGSPAVAMGRPGTSGSAVALLAIAGVMGVSQIMLGGAAAAWLLAAVALAGWYVFVIADWHRGIWGLFIFLPFCGIPTLALHPWKGPFYLSPVLYKDYVFLVPTYLGYLANKLRHRQPEPGPGGAPSWLLAALSLLVVVQLFNPVIPNWVVALIGLKVWLGYLPLYFLVFWFLRSKEELFKLLRLFVVLAILPCTIGVAEFLLSQAMGHVPAMEMIYGEAASPSTHDFYQTDVEGTSLPRFPSTFVFFLFYFAYTLASLVPCYVVAYGDPSIRWRIVAKMVLVLVTIASFLTGSRTAFIFVPMLIGLMLVLGHRWLGSLRAVVLIIGTLLIILAVTGVVARPLYNTISVLFVGYAKDTAYDMLADAVVGAPLGTGTGTNTIAGRHAVAEPLSFSVKLKENFYAKTAQELGVLGLGIFVALLASLIRAGFKKRDQIHEQRLRICASALLAFVIMMAFNNFKHFLLDQDPMNVYFWTFAGILMKLPRLDARAANTEASRLRWSRISPTDGASAASVCLGTGIRP